MADRRSDVRGPHRGGDVARPAGVRVPDEEQTAAEWLWFLLLVGLWMGSTIYGTRQVKPWLATQPSPGTANSPRDVATAYALMLPSLLGICGIQHFYLGKHGRGVLWLLTFGLFGIGLLVDLFTMTQQVNEVNARRAPAIRPYPSVAQGRRPR